MTIIRRWQSAAAGALAVVEGPRPTAEGEVLEWKVNARTEAPPTALIQLAS